MTSGSILSPILSIHHIFGLSSNFLRKIRNSTTRTASERGCRRWSPSPEPPDSLRRKSVAYNALYAILGQDRHFAWLEGFCRGLPYRPPTRVVCQDEGCQCDCYYPIIPTFAWLVKRKMLVNKKLGYPTCHTIRLATAVMETARMPGCQDTGNRATCSNSLSDN